MSAVSDSDRLTPAIARLAEQVERLVQERDALLETCKAASSALRSYQYGNDGPDLAEEIADATDRAIAGVGR